MITQNKFLLREHFIPCEKWWEDQVFLPTLFLVSLIFCPWFSLEWLIDRLISDFHFFLSLFKSGPHYPYFFLHADVSLSDLICYLSSTSCFSPQINSLYKTIKPDYLTYVKRRKRDTTTTTKTLFQWHSPLLLYRLHQFLYRVHQQLHVRINKSRL